MRGTGLGTGVCVLLLLHACLCGDSNGVLRSVLGDYAKNVVEKDDHIVDALRLWPKRREDITKWCKEVSPQTQNVVDVVYPMSGFDIMWPLSCWPNARKLVMVAQQPALPSSTAVDGAILRTIKQFMHLRYLTTIEQNGAEIDAARFFTVGLFAFFDAKVVQSRACSFAHNCIELVYMRTGASNTQEIVYFSDNLLFSAPFLSYVSALPPFATFLKAAEYSLQAAACVAGKATHKWLFGAVIDALTKGSTLVIQDDSGLPFSLFKDSEWKKQVWGTYEGPAFLVDSCTFYQPSLGEFWLALHKTNTTRSLPFPFGYTIIRNCLLTSYSQGSYSSIKPAMGESILLAALRDTPSQQDQSVCMWMVHGLSAQLSPHCEAKSDMVSGTSLSRCVYGSDTETVAIVAEKIH